MSTCLSSLFFFLLFSLLLYFFLKEKFDTDVSIGTDRTGGCNLRKEHISRVVVASSERVISMCLKNVFTGVRKSKWPGKSSVWFQRNCILASLVGTVLPLEARS